MTELARVVEALIFLSPEPVAAAELAFACQADDADIEAALAELHARHAPGAGGIALREVAGGYTFASDPRAEDAARRLFARERLSKLTPAQAETLAIVAYLQPISRPEIARIRGVSADWAVSALQERDLIEESGRSQLGATLYHTTSAFLQLFGLRSLDELPDPAQWDPSPEEAGELRERLLRAGDARGGVRPPASGGETSGDGVTAARAADVAPVAEQLGAPVEASLAVASDSPGALGGAAG